MSQPQTDDERRTAGRDLARKLFSGAPRTKALPDEMARHTIEHLFGDVWQGEDLSTEERSLLTCAVLVAMGKESELQLHVRGARNLGIQRAKLEAMMTHVGHYAGWPNGVSGLRTLNAVWDQMDTQEAEKLE